MGRPGPGRLIDLLVSRDRSSGQAIAPAVPGTPGSVWPGPQGHRRSSRAAARGGLTGGCPGRTRGHEGAAACPGEGGRRRPPFGDTVAGLPWGYFSRARPRAGHACRGRTFFSGLPAPPPACSDAAPPQAPAPPPARSGTAPRTFRHRSPHAPAPLPARSGTAARGLPGAASRGLPHRSRRARGAAPRGPEARLPAGCRTARRGLPRRPSGAPPSLSRRPVGYSVQPFWPPAGVTHALASAADFTATIGVYATVSAAPVTVPVCRFAPSALTSTSAP
ncbi:hypothetical protein SUDANB91_04406 [Streptomyces sp. SudanB91_2054]